MTHIEIKKDGLIYVIDGMPEEPKRHARDDYSYDYSYAMQQYEKALASAPRILCADQEQAYKLLAETNKVPMTLLGVLKPGIYSLPDVEWEKKNVFDYDGAEFFQCKGETKCTSTLRQVAILKESPKGMTIDDIKAIKDELGEPGISAIRVIENSVLPNDMIVVSSYLFKQLKK